MKFVLLVCLLLPAVSFAGPCWWVVGNGGQFKGTDPVDGGLSYRTFVETGGKCTMRGGDTWHGPCQNGVPSVVFSDELKFKNNSLNGDWTLDCQAPAGEVAADDVFLKVRYTRNRTTGALTEQLLDLDGVPIGRQEIIFYRVNIRP